jgi:hypothetical protein
MGRHSSEACRPRTSQKLQEHGLGLIVLMVGKQQMIELVLITQPKQRFVARLARMGLNVRSDRQMHESEIKVNAVALG